MTKTTKTMMISDLLAYDEAQQQVSDLEVYDEGVTEVTDSTRQVTSQGFVVANAVLARTGVYRYRASELGLDQAPYNMPSGRELKIYRAPEVVFNQQTLDAMENLPVTVDHPRDQTGKSVNVTASNWSRFSVGEVRDVTVERDHGTVKSKALVKDQRGIDAVNSGKRFLSPGYKFDLKLTPGTTPGGEQYDGEQLNIRPNHVALCDNPRGGIACRVLDSTGDTDMKTILIGGIPVQVADDAGFAVITQLQQQHARAQELNAKTIKVGDASFTVEQLPAAQTALDAITQELTQLRGKQVTDAQIEEQVQARVKLAGAATKLVPGFVTDGKTTVQIQREVLTSVVAKDSRTKAAVDATLGGKTLEAADEATLGVAFNVALATAPAPTHQTTTRTAADSQVSQALLGGSHAPAGEVVKMQGRAKFIANQHPTTTK